MIIPTLKFMPATSTTPASPVCHTCGTIAQSGKLSCCARGGSWFGKCGATANVKGQHTWYQGIQVCRARQAKATIEQQQNVIERNSNNDGIPVHELALESSAYNNGSTPVKVIATTALLAAVTTNSMEPLARMSITIATNKSINVAANGPITPPANSIISKLDRVSAAEAFSAIDRIEMTASASITTQQNGDLLNVIIHINILLFIAVS